jgi:zinc protease
LHRAWPGRLRAPDYLFERAVRQAIVPPDDPTLRQATSDTVMALRPEDVHAHYAAMFRPDLTTIVVVGDVTVEQARRVVEETFGSWRAVGATPGIDPAPIGPNQPSHSRVPDPTSVQDSVYLAETTGLPVTSPDRYTMLLGNIILGSGFSSRLYQDLRIRSGYVYSATATWIGHARGPATACRSPRMPRT